MFRNTLRSHDGIWVVVQKKHDCHTTEQGKPIVFEPSDSSVLIGFGRDL